MQELLNLYIETFGLGFSRPLLGQKLPNHIINKPRKWYFSEIILIKNNINMKKLIRTETQPCAICVAQMLMAREIPYSTIATGLPWSD